MFADAITFLYFKTKCDQMKGKRVNFVKFMDEEDKKELLIKKVRALFSKVTPDTEEEYSKEFLQYHIHKSQATAEIVSIVFAHAIEQPEYCDLYTRLCLKQVKKELSSNDNVSTFSAALIERGKELLSTTEEDEAVKEKLAEIDDDTDEKKKEEILTAYQKIRTRKFGTIKFIGHLHLHSLLSTRVIIGCVDALLKSVRDRPTYIDGFDPDEDAIECTVILFETIGFRLHEQAEEIRAAATAAAAVGAKPRNPVPLAFPISSTIAAFEEAMPLVSDRLRERIERLLALRANGWVEPKPIVVEPKKIVPKIVVDENDNDAECERTSCVDDEEHSHHTVLELHRATAENAQLRIAVGDLQDAMEEMRAAIRANVKAMASLEQRNRALLEMIKHTQE